MTERVAIVDSQGQEPLHELYTSTLSHVTFDGVTPFSLRGTPVHGHGSWCGWDFFSQSRKPVECLFIRIFDQNGRSVAGSMEYARDALKDFKPHRINKSWGSDQAYTQRQLEGLIESWGSALVVFAAGNEGRDDQSYPQKQLVGHPQVKIIAACDIHGVRAVFSSTGDPGKQYADISYLGVDSLSMNGADGRVVGWNGTSSSSPHAGGDFWAKGLTAAEVDPYLRKLVLRDDNENGIPDGIHPDFEGLIRRGEFHPDMGIGIGEIGRQENMRETGLGLGVGIASDSSIRLVPASMYHDFDLIGV